MQRRSLRGPLLAAALSGCSFGVGSGGSCAYVPPNGALGQAHFTYVCSCAGPPSDDAWCDTGPTGGLPDVAVGAPFQLTADGAVSTANGSRLQTFAPEPAAPALATSTPQGWAPTQAGWLGFVVRDGANVYDYLHIRARDVSSITLVPDLLSALEVGSVTTVTASAFADDGTGLAGSIPCTFASSDASVAAVVGQGRVGHVTVAHAGDATISATCLGRQASLFLHFAPAQDASAAEGAADADEDALDGATDADAALSAEGGG